MEPFIMTLHSSSPPPLDEDGDGEAGTEHDEFGDFGGFCSRRGDADPTEPPPTLREPSHALKEATHPPSCSFHPPAEPSGSSGSDGDQIQTERKDCEAESSLHLTNGYAEEDLNAGTHGASRTFSPEEETGFADFTVFTEQAAHPWCCGLSPLNSTETWADQMHGPGHEVVLDSEPRSHCASESKGNVCTKVQHCEEREAAQDPPQPQRAAAAFVFPSPRPHVREEGVGERVDRWRETSYCLNYVQTSEEPEDGDLEKDRETSVSTVPQMISVYESASEDLESVADDFSFEGVSADLEPIVSSLASQEDQTDWDQTDAEDEELENNWHSYSFGNSSGRKADLSQTEAEQALGHCDQPATQETSATSNQSQSVTYTGYGYAGFDDRGSDCVQAADVSVQSLGSLPPSDSFADFCSAPTQEAGEGSWAEFHDQRDEEEGSQPPNRGSSLQSDGSTEEEQDRVGHCGASRRSSCQVSLSCRVQRILCASFPEVVVPSVEDEEEEEEEEEEDDEEEEEVLSLCAHLHTRHLPQSEEEKTPELSGAQRVLRGLWWPHRDVHSAVGLHFQWSGSHTNRTLLRCLGVDTRNILFIGMKKQPVAVPAFASSLGMLEPTKDAVAAVCTSGYAAVTAREPAGPQNQQDPSMDSVQGALPSSQRDWSSRGLSSSQDGCCALNLDYFGPEEESRSRSSSSPPPGVDRELYELTISKLETGTNSCHLVDTLNRLMSDAEKTSTSVRKAPEDEELSAEAGRLISGLPDLSFMTAKVLMFPSVLVPAL